MKKQNFNKKETLVKMQATDLATSDATMDNAEFLEVKRARASGEKIHGLVRDMMFGTFPVHITTGFAPPISDQSIRDAQVRMNTSADLLAKLEFAFKVIVSAKTRKVSDFGFVLSKHLQGVEDEKNEQIDWLMNYVFDQLRGLDNDQIEEIVSASKRETPRIIEKLLMPNDDDQS